MCLTLLPRLRRLLPLMLLVLLFSPHLFAQSGVNGGLRAQQGVLDLRDYSFRQEGILNLHGQWEFYPLKLHQPAELPPPPALSPAENPGQSAETQPGQEADTGSSGELSDVRKPAYVPVPAKWSVAKETELQGEPFGYGTYRLTILLPETAPRRLGLYLDSIGTAYELYVDGEKKAQVGTVGTGRRSSHPKWRKHVVEVDRRDSTMELVFQVSNFHDTAGGIHYPLNLGTVKQAYAKRYGKLLLDLFLFGSLLIMALYHFGLFMYRRKDLSPLYFGFLALLFAVRVIFHNGTYVLLLFPEFPWALQMKIAYLTFSIPPMLFYRFITSLYPDYTPRWSVRLSDLLSLLYSAAVIILPNWIYARGFELFAVYILAVSVAVIYVLVRALRDRKSGSLLFAAGFVLFFLFIVNDIVKTLWGTETIYMVPIGLLVFIFFQSLVMTRRFASAFADSERLSAYLMKLNTAMERFVPREFLSFLGKESVMDVELGDHSSRTMTVLFADMRGFTSLSEKMTPDENFRFINSFLRRLGPIIRANRGFVDKYIGDGIMALFPAHPRDAVEAAIGLRRELTVYNRDRAKAGYQDIDFGIGIHTGELMLGTVGENRRMDGTVISDVVNLASRIEELTRDHDLGIAVSESVYRSVADEPRYHIRFVGRERVKGKSELVAVYEVSATDG
jgi:class 3 adenylate cyclase